MIWSLFVICALAATMALVGAAHGTQIRASETSHGSSCTSGA